MRRATLIALAAVAATGVAACSSPAATSTPGGSSGGSPTSASASALPQAVAGTPTVVATGLVAPWGLVFLPDGSALVTERDTHRLVRIGASGARTVVGVVPGVKPNAGEGGLLGLALSPQFATDRTLFTYYTSASDNRIVRFRYDGTAVSDFSPIFTGIPSAGTHNGGRIAFGPDGYLYVTTGDAAERDRAPDKTFLGGKVLRMTAAGQPAPGNPYPGSVVWTVGHRNPQGLAFGPGGNVYEAEFGTNKQDEINLLRAGNDYGWPSAEGTDGSGPGKTLPLKTFSTLDTSPSGLVYAGGSLWMAALAGERLYRLPVVGDSLGDPQTLLEGQYGRLRTVVIAPDGALWVTTSNRDGRGKPAAKDDRIIRIPLS